jgi:hypothetical protein
MAQEPDSLAFRFAVVLALALIVLATMWVAPRMLRTILLRQARIATRFTGLNIWICSSGSESSPISIRGEDLLGNGYPPAAPEKNPSLERSLRRGPHLHFDLLGGRNH